jgi:hypothetical protein
VDGRLVFLFADAAGTTAFVQPDDLAALAESSAVVALIASMALATLQEHPS